MMIPIPASETLLVLVPIGSLALHDVHRVSAEKSGCSGRRFAQLPSQFSLERPSPF